MKDKSLLRKNMLKTRIALSPTTRQQLSQVICQKLLSLPQYTQTKHILAYSAIHGEVSLDLFLRRALSDQKALYLPKVIDQSTIAFYQITSTKQLIHGKFNILEPTGKTTQYQNQPAFAVVPGLAFNSQRQRVGYGKGYYDRFLKQYQQIYSVGVGYSFQMNQCFHINNLDHPLNLLISEKRNTHHK